MENKNETQKINHESTMLSQFLSSKKGLTYRRRDKNTESDHDGSAMDGSSQIAELELTRYDVDRQGDKGSPQLRAVNFWYDQLWRRLDNLRRTRSDFRKIAAAVRFSARLPRKSDADNLAVQIIEVAAKAWNERNEMKLLPGMKRQPVTTVFIENRTGRTSNYQDFETAYINPDSRQFGLIDTHISQIILMETSSDWPEWSGPDMKAGGRSYCQVTMQRIIKDKSKRALSRGRGNKPAWLVILCDLFDDTQTTIFPHDDDERGYVKAMFNSCDYTNCPFSEIWLMAEKGGDAIQVWSAPPRVLPEM